MLQTEGDTGPMLMYTYARCCGIEDFARLDSTIYDPAALHEPQATDLIWLLSQYEELCVRALEASEPSVCLSLLLHSLTL